MNEWEILLNFCYGSSVRRLICLVIVFCVVMVLIYSFSSSRKNRSHKDSIIDCVLGSLVATLCLCIILDFSYTDVSDSFVLDNNALIKVYPQNWLALKPIEGEIVSYEKQNFVAYNGTYEIRVSFGGEFLPVYRAIKECGCVEHFIRSRIKQNAHFLTAGSDKLFSDFLKEDNIIVLSIEKTDNVRIQKL